jgi:hypothetical protein
MIVAGFVYYLFSEQWIWTRGLMMRPRSSFYYNIHGLVGIDSQLPLGDLDYFAATDPPARTDLIVRVDRHGTPSRVPRSIAYDEHLGRFGFGLTVIPGDITEIVVSPLLETSPAFLYTNVVEPVLSWVLVTRGYSLARAGAAHFPAVAGVMPPPGLLLAGRGDRSYGLSRLCAAEGLAFMGDDRVIIGRDCRVRSFPKPVTASREMLPGQKRSWGAALALRLQRLLYSRSIRRLGLMLSERQLPAATLNTVLQRIIPQPKFPLAALAGGIVYGDEAVPARLILQEKGDNALTTMSLDDAIDRLMAPGDQGLGFHPYSLLSAELGHWNGTDWIEEERRILRAGLAGCRPQLWRYSGERWWRQIIEVVTEQTRADRPMETAPVVKAF